MISFRNMLGALLVFIMFKHCNGINEVKRNDFYSNIFSPLLLNPPYYYSSKKNFRLTPHNEPILGLPLQMSTPASFLFNLRNLDLQPEHSTSTNSNNKSVSEYNYPKPKNSDLQYSTEANLKLDTVEVSGIACDNNADEGFFRAVIRGGGKNVTPVFEEQHYYKQGTGLCAVEFTPNGMVVDVRSESFATCGVRNCTEIDGSNFFCLRVRFPAVQGLRLPEDTILILRCRMQEHMVSYTHRVGLSVNTGVFSKNTDISKNNKIATGGATNSLHCQLNAFRVAEDGHFTRVLRNGEILTLGEELLIQIIVFNENVWRWSRLGDVWFSNEIGSTKVPLVSAEGCVLPEARAVCPMQPKQLGPFVHTLIIRAPMMSDGSSETNVILNVRIVACRHQQGCTTRCGRSSRTYKNKILNSDLKLELVNNVNKSVMNNPNVTDENSYLLPYLSDAFQNEREYIRYRLLLKRNISELASIVNNHNVKEDTDDIVVKDLSKFGKNHVTRLKREVSEEANDVAKLTFVVVQDMAKVTAPSSHQIDYNGNIMYAIASLSIAIVTILAAILFCYWKNRQRISKEYLGVHFI